MKQKINNRQILEDGQVILNDQSLFETLFIDPHCIEKINSQTSPELEEYNKWAKIYDLPQVIDLPIEIDHVTNQQKWLMPDKYKNLDIEEYTLSLCKNEEEENRTVFELQEYKDRDLYNLLRFLVYLVDNMKKNKIVYGIGRGSSVSSFILYLIGLHKVNSLKYNLDIKEFLK